MNFVRTAVVYVLFFSVPLCANTYNRDAYTQNLTAVVQFFDTMITQEAEQLEKRITPSMQDSEIRALALEHKDLFVLRCKHAFYQQLTAEQRALALRLLTALDRLAQTTTQDLMNMTAIHDNPEQFEACNRLFEQYYQTHCGNVTDCKHLEAHEVTAALDKISLMKTGNKTYDTVIHFMCHCACLNDLCARMHYDQESKPTELQILFSPVMQAIGSTFVVFNDCYYYQGWQEQFVRNGAIFAHTRSVTQPLLAALTA